jgi:hypothetical protein
MAVALLVLCLAVGGTAYAAATITGKQIKDGTITSADVKNKTLQTKDISKQAKDKLRGQTGPAGPQGIQGVPGPSNAYAVRRTDGLAAQPGGSNVLVKRLVLPAGKFTVESKVNLSDTSGAPRLVECRLVNGTAVLDSTFVTVSGAAGGWVCPNMTVVDLTAASTAVELHVLTPAASAVLLLPNAVMVGTKVGALTSAASGGNG